VNQRWQAFCLSGYVRLRPGASPYQIEDEYDLLGAHAEPINIPAMNTKTPPRTTWKTAETKGVSM
jgi:hypothetical protein